MKPKSLSIIALIAAILAVYWPAYAGENEYVFQPPYSVYFHPDFQVDGLYYEIVDGGVQLTRAEGRSKTIPHYEFETLTIPSTVVYNGKTYNVVGIGPDTFMGNRTLTSVTLPVSLQYIDKGAFSYTLLSSITLPTSLNTIGEHAFSYCSLTSVEIPNSVMSLGAYAFAGCEELKTATLGTGLTSIGEGCFGYTYKNWFNPSGGNEWYPYYTYIYDIYCNAQTPPTCENLNGHGYPFGYDYMYFRYDLYKNCNLHVPLGSKKVYSETPFWKYFISEGNLDIPGYDNIIEDIQSGLAETVAEGNAIRVEGGRIVGEGIMDVYDLGGRQVACGTAEQLPDLPAGFYVVRNSLSTAKVLVP